MIPHDVWTYGSNVTTDNLSDAKPDVPPFIVCEQGIFFEMMGPRVQSPPTRPLSESNLTHNLTFSLRRDQ